MPLQKSSSLKAAPVSKNTRIAIVWSRFNEVIVRSLLKGAERALKEAGLSGSAVEIFEVPGAFEIPLAALHAAKSKRYDGIVCLGAVVRGETPHFDYVCRAAAEGVLRVQLETGLPVGFGVLTTDTVPQAQARAGEGNDNKGFEAAKVVLEMVQCVGFFKKKR